MIPTRYVAAFFRQSCVSVEYCTVRIGVLAAFSVKLA